MRFPPITTADTPPQGAQYDRPGSMATTGNREPLAPTTKPRRRDQVAIQNRMFEDLERALGEKAGQVEVLSEENV